MSAERRLLQIIAVEVAVIAVALGLAYTLLRDRLEKVDGVVDRVTGSKIIKGLLR